MSDERKTMTEEQKRADTLALIDGLEAAMRWLYEGTETLEFIKHPERMGTGFDESFVSDIRRIKAGKEAAERLRKA